MPILSTAHLGCGGVRRGRDVRYNILERLNSLQIAIRISAGSLENWGNPISLSCGRISDPMFDLMFDRSLLLQRSRQIVLLNCIAFLCRYDSRVTVIVNRILA